MAAAGRPAVRQPQRQLTARALRKPELASLFQASHLLILTAHKRTDSALIHVLPPPYPRGSLRDKRIIFDRPLRCQLHLGADFLDIQFASPYNLQPLYPQQRGDISR